MRYALAIWCVGVAADCAAQRPNVLYFRQDWCPSEQMVQRLERAWLVTRSGCCIFKIERLHQDAVAPDELDEVAHAVTEEQDLSVCSGHENITPQERARREAAQRLERLERRRRELDDLRVELRTLDSASVCANWGDQVRSAPSEDHDPAVLAAYAAEAKRRGLRMSAPAASKRQLGPGDTVCQMLASWGRPEGSNSTTTANGRSVQFVYGLGTYVYVVNGTVTATQVAR